MMYKRHGTTQVSPILIYVHIFETSGYQVNISYFVNVTIQSHSA